ncbi:unsaturated glucuronyl hydrolase [Gaeumannomyces tritici R3-111a-1]|uniref:Unsaturated glucuronyl hydrolase n=1 Tax=Gaeumannomyces tritici (strain R3-111a-1) TaxID=644352 RepID=J3PAY6_GAET3|nr:unsaturated glucuronyl hydrolase [Gaeumannomyces tritici R3-111a-1]EJT71402.1 unsaturated glucuronyl hydrolase [Gaeumannomyces tritici R3-111a-1]
MSLSTPPSGPDGQGAETTPATASITSPPPTPTIADYLAELFAENVAAKIYRTASRAVGIPHAFPEHVPQAGRGAGAYSHREAEFWTCGFFPGSVHCLLERLVRFPHSVRLDTTTNNTPNTTIAAAQLRAIQAGLQHRRHHHHGDLQADEGNPTETLYVVGKPTPDRLRSSLSALLDSVLRAASALATRYVPAARAVRSWDSRVQRNLTVEGTETNLLVIIDSMCNLDLLYYAAGQLGAGDPTAAHLSAVATAHATTVLRTHLRPEEQPPSPDADDSDSFAAGSTRYAGQWYSTHHVANLDPRTGAVKRHFTAQGWSDSSQWARGQAWAILGYAQTHAWTRDPAFLRAACGLADGRYVPPWDFDAPPDADRGFVPRDSSAGVVAANGMLVLSQSLRASGGGGDDDSALADRFLRAAVALARDALLFALAPERAELLAVAGPGAGGCYYRHARIEVADADPGPVDGGCGGGGGSFEAILKHGTANNNPDALRRYADHGLYIMVNINTENIHTLLAVAGPGAGGCYYRHARIEVADADPGPVDGGCGGGGGSFEAILKHGTANNNPDALRRYADHGLVPLFWFP